MLLLFININVVWFVIKSDMMRFIFKSDYKNVINNILSYKQLDHTILQPIWLQYLTINLNLVKYHRQKYHSYFIS